MNNSLNCAICINSLSKKPSDNIPEETVVTGAVLPNNRKRKSVSGEASTNKRPKIAGISNHHLRMTPSRAQNLTDRLCNDKYGNYNFRPLPERRLRVEQSLIRASRGAFETSSTIKVNRSVVTTIFPCEHKFHQTCINQWTITSITCPYDRQPIMSSNPKIPVPETLPAQLTAAASAGNMNLVQAIVEWGVDVNTENSDSESPLSEAIQNQHFEVAVFLINHGATGTGNYLTLGNMYERGLGTDINLEEAVRYYRLSAEEQGNPEGYNNLGRMYESGLGVSEENFVEAFRCYECSALWGNAEGLTHLGRMYETASGTDESHKKAFRCYQAAADKKDADALNNLGRMNEVGIGTTINFEKAFACYQLSADQGDPDGYYNLGRMYEEAIGTDLNFDLAKRCYDISEQLSEQQSGAEG